MVENEALPLIASPKVIEQGIRLANILMPYAMEQRKAFFEKEPNQTHARLVHYTTAEAALKIINSNRFWMRNTHCMSDCREVQHGFQIFTEFFGVSANLNAFTESLDKCAQGVAKEAIQMFNDSWNDIQFNTYISSISEHRDEEDQHGRLSMWRAFGANTARVGIVLKLPSISQGPLALNLLFSPVAYLAKAAAYKVIEQVIENIRANTEYLRTVDRPILVRTLFMMFLAGVVCLKHEGFVEEREWRAIYAPKRWPSPLMESSTEIIAGIPQIVHKIPLDSSASAQLIDLDFATVFDRLIVGPTQYAWPMHDAFLVALTKTGVREADKRLFASGIPLRT